MKKSALRHFMAVLLLTILAGCASSGGKLQKAGETTTFDMRIETSMDWSRIKSARQEVWTIDGSALNSLGIFSGIRPNEHVFMLSKEKKSRPDGPWFRPGMRADEVRDIVVDGLRGIGWSNIATDNLRPASFGNSEGLRFDLAMTNADGLIYKATVAAVERGGKLTLLLWKAPKEHYFDRDIEAVNRMLDGVRFLD